MFVGCIAINQYVTLPWYNLQIFQNCKRKSLFWEKQHLIDFLWLPTVTLCQANYFYVEKDSLFVLNNNKYSSSKKHSVP